LESLLELYEMDRTGALRVICDDACGKGLAEPLRGPFRKTSGAGILDL